MKNIATVVSVGWLCSAFALDTTRSYVASKYHGGRLGDQIIMNLQAITAARKLGVTYLHRPFAGSEQLVLSRCGEQMERRGGKEFRRTVQLRSLPGSHSRRGILYIVPYGCAIPMVGKAEAKKLLSPITPINTPAIPTDCISVALHIRTGGGRGIENGRENRRLMDHPVNQRRFPRKFIGKLGYNHYMQGLRKIRHIFKEQKLYVHLFTDDQNPQHMVEKLRVSCRDNNIEFECRQEGNHHTCNIIEDFHGMAQCNCLIRPDSNMSKMAEYIGNHCIVLAPGSCKISSRGCAKLRQRLEKVVVTPQHPASEPFAHRS